MEHQQQQSASRVPFAAPGWPSALPQGDVFRQVAFPVKTFDYLKQFQRRYEAMNGVRLTNNQALAIIIEQHKEQTESNNGECGEHGNTGS